MDAYDTIDVVVNENPNPSDSSKLDGEYHVFEMNSITTEDLNRKNEQTDIFHDWKMLISIN